MAPLFSICIPTYNRADILNDCLMRLEALRKLSDSFEIVVSDNASPDGTTDVLAAHMRRYPHVRAFRMPENRGSYSNWLNAISKARGEFIVYLADDDSIIPENLIRHAAQAEKERDIAALYADWIAWDDENERELHRYFGIASQVTFAPPDNMALVNFMLQTRIPPEIGLLRRSLLLKSLAFHGRTFAHHLMMYRMSRFGRVVFDPLPFYREHRVLKRQFQRTEWANMGMQLQIIGDEMRLTLESLLLLALQDSGAPQVPDDQVAKAKQIIDAMLHARIGLEIDRACARREFILAVELKRRLVLWHGPGTRQDIERDFNRLTVPAALQSIRELFRSLSDTAGLVFRGFESRQIQDRFAGQNPDVPLVDKEVPGQPVLIVHRDEKTRTQDASLDETSQVAMFSSLIDLYRVDAVKVDLAGQ